MRFSFKNNCSHLDKINNITNDCLVYTRFLRESIKDEFLDNSNNDNNSFELIKKCHSNLISPKFKENYYNIIKGVLPNHNIKLFSSYYYNENLKKNNFNENRLLNLKKCDKLLKKHSNVINLNKNNEKNKTKKIIKSSSTKEIFQNKLFNLNNNTFLNKYKNTIKSCNIKKKNLSKSVLYSPKNTLSDSLSKKNVKNSSDIYYSCFKDTFYNEVINLKSELESQKKVNAGVLKFKRKLNLYKL